MATAAAKKTLAEEPAPLKPAKASREDNLTYDLKHLAAFDISPLHADTDFLAYTRDSVQMLVNKLFALPRHESDAGPAAVMPQEEMFKLPRKMPIPKVMAKTRFQKFMEERNMHKRKRSKLVFDEVSGDWKPRWGYNSIKNSQKDAGAIHEVRTGEDPNADPFVRQAAEASLHKAKQKMREVRNKVEAAGGRLRASVPDLDDVKSNKRGKEGLKEAVKRAQISSASFGKFDRKAPNETTNLQPKRQKVTQHASLGEEKERYLKAASRLLSGEGGVDRDRTTKAGVQGDQAAGTPRLSKNAQASKRRSKQGGRKRK